MCLALGSSLNLSACTHREAVGRCRYMEGCGRRIEALEQALAAAALEADEREAALQCTSEQQIAALERSSQG